MWFHLSVFNIQQQCAYTYTTCWKFYTHLQQVVSKYFRYFHFMYMKQCNYKYKIICNKVYRKKNNVRMLNIILFA